MLSELYLVFQERVSDPAVKSSNFAARSNVSPYAPPMITMDNDDGISYTGLVTCLIPCEFFQ